MFLIFYIFIFLLGLCIGSFLNCVVYRMELQEDMPKGSPQRKAVSFLRGKSFCPYCKHTLSWQDLIPVFSFLFLKGKCRYCSKKISIQYPLVEILTGILFILIWSCVTPGVTQIGVTQVFLFFVSCFLIIIFVYDLKHYIIPDKVLFPAIIITFVFRFLEFAPSFDGAPGRMTGWIFNPLWAGLGAGAFFLFFFLVSGGRWMGFGDVKLAFFMGLFLGYPNILVALFLAFFLGAIIGIGLIIFGSKNLKSEVPFGPFLITGTFIALLYGSEIIQWYTHIFLF